MEPLVEAYRAVNAFQAHVVAHFLQGAGIPAFVDGDQWGIGVGGIPTGSLDVPRVLVPARELTQARLLIATAEDLDDGPLIDAEDDPPVDAG